MQRVIRGLSGPLAKALNAYDPDDQLAVHLKMKDKQLEISIQDDPLGLELLIEELEKMSRSNHASVLRRQLNSLQEGDFYGRLLVELNTLEVEKKQKRFWQNAAKVNRYTRFFAN